jgi:hypothetical protein
MLVKIIKPVVGMFQIACFVGEETELNDELAKELIEQEFAVKVEGETIENAVQETKREKATKR